MKNKRGSFVLVLFIILLLGFSVVFFISPSFIGKLIYDASYTNVSEHNITSSSGFIHLNISNGDLKLYMPFDKNNSLNKTYDYTNNSNDGNFVGSPEFINSGYFSGGYNFSGGYEYINVSDSDSLDITGNMTLSAWVDSNISERIQPIISKNSYSLKINEDGKPFFELISENPNDTWTNVSSTLGSGDVYSLIVYNGKLFSATTDSGRVYVYNKTSDEWSNHSGSLSGNDSRIFVIYNKSLYLGMSNAQGSVYKYNEDLGEWISAGNISSVILSGTVYNDKLYVGTYNSKVYVYNESNNSWTNTGNLNDATPGSVEYIFSLIPYKGNLYAGTDMSAELLFYNDSNQTWNYVGTIPGTNQIRSLGIYGENLYIGANSGDIFSYNDSSESFVNVSDGLGSGSVSSFSVYNGDFYATISPGEIYVYDELNNNWTNLGVDFGATMTSLTPYNGKLYVSSGSSVYYSGNGSSVYSNISIVEDSWNHISASYDKAGLKIYLGGTLVGESFFSGNIFENNDSLLIGKEKGSSHSVYGSSKEEFFSGKIDEVMVFNKALSTSEIQSIYNNQSSRFFSTGELEFNESFGSNNRLNISIENCSTIGGSYLQAKTSSGDYSNFTNCELNNYEISGDNVIIKLISDSNGFFTPLINGNVSFSSWTYTAPSQQEDDSSGGGGSSSIDDSEIVEDEEILVEEALDENYWEQTETIDETNTESVEEQELEQIVNEITQQENQKSIEGQKKIVEKVSLARKIIDEKTKEEKLIITDKNTKEEKVISISEIEEQEKTISDKIARGEDVKTEKIIAESFSKEFFSKQRIKLEIKKQNHSFGVVEVRNDSTIIQIQSTPKQAELKINETKEFDTSEDGLEDVGVKLHSVENGKSKLTFYVVYHGLVADEDIKELEQREKSKKFFFFLVGFMAILIILFVIYRFRKFNN